MKSLNQCISLFLVFTMLLPSASFAVEQLPGAEEASVNFINSLPGAEEADDVEPVPTNPPGTPPGVTCSQVDQTPNPLNGVCCLGLEKNALGKCDEPELKDTALITCSTGADCANGTGCFPQSASDLFSNLSPGTEDEQIISEKKQEFNAHIEETLNPKPVGAVCVHSKDCVSYSCKAGICEDKKVCRYAGEGEIALAGINCGKDLIKKPNGLCEVDPNAKNPIYLGLLSESTVKPLGQCEFQLDEDSRKKSIIAMQSLRAMEWFLASISVPSDKECFDVMPLLKHEIGETFLTTRKSILTNFTDVLNQIEFDYKQLIEAKANSPRQLTIHTDEAISEGDLATRQTSGYDNLMMMYRRNLLFQSYEIAMLETVKASNVKVAGLSQKMGEWKDSANSWDIGTKTVAAYNCEGSKYKTKKPFRSWKTKYYNSVQDRWSVHYEVSGSAAGNASIVKRDGVAEVLRLIGGKATKAEAIADFTKSKYYLIDPMLFAGMSYQGQGKALKKKSSFLGLFGGFKDLRKAYYIRGDGAGSYSKMYKALQPKITEFYKNLKTNKAQKGFIYEPELLTTEAKDCLDNPANPAKCEKFQPFLDNVADEAFAHFLAYSYSNKDSYQGFFTNATTYRRRLLAKMEVDMQNISKYYETIISHRNKQNECIERVVNGLADSGILESGDDGLTEGGTYYDPTLGNQIGAVTTGRKGNNALRKLSPLSRGKFSFNLADSSLKKLGGNSMMDNVATSNITSSGAGVSGSASAFLAARKDAMIKANSKATNAGIKVADKEKAVMDSINSLARSSTSGSGSAAASAGAAGYTGSSSFGFGNGTGESSVSGNDGEMTNTTTANVPPQNTIGIGGAANAGAAGGDGAFSGLGAGAGGTGTDGNSVDTKGGTDGTGMSDEEKDRLMAEYERNKGDYKGTDEDGIFSKVSKAYVRNLDKVLTKKKKIEP